MSANQVVTQGSRLIPENGNNILEFDSEGQFSLHNLDLRGSRLWICYMSKADGKVIPLDHGELQALDAKGKVLWTSRTAKSGKNARLKVRDEGTAVIYVNDGNREIWSSSKD